MIVCVYPKSPENDNPFLDLLKKSLSKKIPIIDGTWINLFKYRYDILLVNWPETFFRGLNPVKSIMKSFAFFLLSIKIRIQRIKVVTIIHNESPHEPGSYLENLFLKFWKKLNLGEVYLHETSVILKKNQVTIPHGSYSDLLITQNSFEVIKSERAISFGAFRKYKNLDRLIICFNESKKLQLLIVGKSFSNEYFDELQKSILNEDIISLRNERISFDELVLEIKKSKVAIFVYEKIYNSGAVLFALSCNIPVIATNSNSMRLLQEEVGREWIYLVHGDITMAKIQTGIDSLLVSSSARGKEVKFSLDRNWTTIATKYVEFFAQILILEEF